jgi:hypothetical protein
MLALYLIYLKRWKKLKLNPRKTLIFVAFVLISCLPFIYITELISLELFLDSFENSQNYVCIQDKNNEFETSTFGDYIIIQKSSHPDFQIEESDYIIYCDFEGEISYTKVSHINSIASVKRYHVEGEESENEQCILFQNQIIGKILEIIDDNFINSISMKIWEISINNLNIRSILTS